MQTKTSDFSFKVNAKSLDDSGTFVGLASTYGGPPDAYGDVIERGAFAGAIQNQGRGFPLLFAHDQSQPLGLAKISDSLPGLVCNGALLMSDPAAQRAYEHLKMGSIRGLSIGFRIDPADVRYSDDGKVTTLKNIRLHEISLCAAPACPGAVVTSVKNLAAVETVLRGYRHADVTDDVLQQLKGIDVALRTLLRKDAAGCSCLCESCPDNCQDCTDQCDQCDTCLGCVAARADDAAIADALTTAAADLKKLTAITS
jgi:HK97 family phage prohead protease